MSSIRRSVQVMEFLACKSPLGVRAVASQLGLPLGSVHRLLLDLEEEGIAERSLDGEWELSFRLLEITGIQLERIALPSLARPFAEHIAEATRETVNINALAGIHGVCIDKVRGSEGMQLDLRIGSRGSIYCGSAGKAMLAYLNEIDQQKLLDEPMPALTPKTITDPAALKAELVRIKARGYSIDDQEVVMGVYCVAGLDGNGRPVGAISITGSSVKKPGAEIQPLVDMLNEACGHVSRRLGFRGEWPVVSSGIARKSARRAMRRAWVMKLKPGNEAIYKKTHDEIWPEMLALMKRNGTHNFSIYRYGLLLFAYQEFDTAAGAGQPIDPIVWKWWGMMGAYMETNPDFSPWQEPLDEMFHAD